MTVQAESPASSSDTARARIRELIISGDFAPGSRLRERELSQTLAVSRVPVREALQQLEAEGFIDTSPRRGATVKQITLRDVNELFDVRLSLEVLAARLAAQAAARGQSSLRLQHMMDQAEEQPCATTTSRYRSAIRHYTQRLWRWGATRCWSTP